MNKKIIDWAGIVALLSIIGAVVAGLNYLATAKDLNGVKAMVVQNTKADKHYRASQVYKELLGVKFAYDKQFGVGCQTCTGANLTEYQRITAELQLLAVQLGISNQQGPRMGIK